MVRLAAHPRQHQQQWQHSAMSTLSALQVAAGICLLAVVSNASLQEQTWSHRAVC